jgi:hypothetical protein
MKKYTSINSPVDITVLGFGRNLRTFPKRMEFGGTTYDFIDAGLRTIIHSDGHVSQVFTMTDGAHDYRLRNKGGIWTLLGMTR